MTHNPHHATIATPAVVTEMALTEMLAAQYCTASPHHQQLINGLLELLALHMTFTSKAGDMTPTTLAHSQLAILEHTALTLSQLAQDVTITAADITDTATSATGEAL